ncbi:hypothetical protein KHM83_13410 [Fusibacter paucivorans]|uniref:Citrate transporter-like domain-containing protein n=1 Tax=Fusibacter paucivorans TaxID=76009 RepID=A0ABS5PR87_9FIRM|nr:SLC13 family permease [Fusibacter paucivorans]MBS7527678.1 hypothetical protein [Fusibacter paucivorans]
MGKNKRIITMVVALFFTFVFGYVCPTWGTVTPIGLKILGALLGWLVLAASGFGLLVPSLIALVAMALSGYYTATEIISNGIGSTVNILVIFIFVLVEVFSSSKTAEYIVRAFLSRKFVNGHPYMLTATFLITMVALGTIVGSLGIIMLAIVLLENIVSIAGIKMTDDWVRFLLISIVALSGVTELLFPFKPFAQIFIGLFNSSLSNVGYAVNEGTYMLTGVIVAVIAIMLLMLEARFIFHFDFEKLKALDTSVLKTNEFTKMSKKQGIILITVLLSFLFPTIIMLFPKASTVYMTLNGIGQTLFMAACVAFLSIVKVDGEPIMSPARVFAKAVNWDIIFAIASVSLLGGALGAENAGFTPWLLGIFTDLFNHISIIPIIILTAILSCFLTQVFSNLATGMILCSVLAPLSILLFNRGINVSVFPAIIGIGVCAACLLPSSSGQAAIMLSSDIFENGSSWALKKGVYVLVAVTIACMLSGTIVSCI